MAEAEGFEPSVPLGTFAFKLREATYGSSHGVRYCCSRLGTGVTRTLVTDMNETRTETRLQVSHRDCPAGPTRAGPVVTGAQAGLLSVRLRPGSHRQRTVNPSAYAFQGSNP
jgi:hypothetical protein